MDVPSIKEELKEIIFKAIKTNYLSESCLDNIQTVNHYQSLILGETETFGYRSNRNVFMDQINFQGNKVLDLGSNLGQLSRNARKRGAYLVDGFEYDRFFIEIANAVNVYNDITRVSFYQRDITDPTIYTEHYDIVLAFAVFSYIQSVLNMIAEITDGVLVLETHKLLKDLDSRYLEPILRYFPCYKILGETELGMTRDPNLRRAIIVFAKQRSVLASALKINE